MEIFERNMKTQERTNKLIKSPKSAQKSTLNVDGTITPRDMGGKINNVYQIP